MTRVREQQLIRKAAAGDRSAAGELVEAHQASLYAYMLRLSGRPDMAEDVVQEAFIRVLVHLDRFDPRYRFSTWLFTIARRVFLNIKEKKSPSSDTDRVGEWLGSSGGPDAAPAARESLAVHRDVLQNALMQLSIEQREVIVLFHQHDWPIWLIAEQMQMPEGTVKSHLHRGRTRLRELMLKDPSVAANPAEFQEAWS